MFVVKSKEIFSPNSDIRDKNTRYNLNLHFPSTNLKLVQRGVFILESRFLTIYQLVSNVIL